MDVLFYKSPKFVKPSRQSLAHSDCEQVQEKAVAFKDRIPSELSFDNPCSLLDFMEFLRYVEHDAENLQFYVWLQDYTQRFFASKSSDQALSPEWDTEGAPQPPVMGPQPTGRPPNGFAANFDALNSPTSFGPSSFGDHNLNHSELSSSLPSTAKTGKTTAEAAASEANTQAGLKWQPFTIQPYRDEIARVIAHYLIPGAPRELNLSHIDRNHVLHALQHTTHPSAFNRIKEVVEAILRYQSHPNFIRWSICNTNKPRVIFARVLAASHILLGFGVGVLLVLSHAPRWWRIVAALLWFVGFSILFASLKGLCLILQVTHARNIRPWTGNDEESSLYGNKTSSQDDNVTLTNISTDRCEKGSKESFSSKRPFSFDTWGSSNTYTHESWVQKYKQKHLVRKIFDRQVWIQNAQVRFIQDKIALQSYIWAFLIALVLTVAFVVIPSGNLL
ncbi:MAG: hypothetical protein M1837_007381 [Sclerophora amabilis]|nr:MAG: hypothetical protein M1837_007381 [Sclerophora amabilis]